MRTNMIKKAAFLRYAKKEKAKGSNCNTQVAALVLVFIFVSSCATLQVSKEVQSGRIAMHIENPKAAIPHFEAAAQEDPNYITDFTLLDIGIWTYVGMAYYQAGEKEKALENFKQAKQRHREDHFARVFLGLLMSQDGQRREGKAELVAGLNGLGSWLDTIRHSARTRTGELWDPGDYLAREIGQTLKLLQAEEVNWRAINENVVRLARNFDDEIDEVKRDKQFEINEDDGGGSPS